MTADESLHAWLFKAGPATADEMFDEMRVLRLGGVPLDDLPKSLPDLQDAMRRLERSGLASHGDGGWRWSEPTKKERTLFT